MGSKHSKGKSSKSGKDHIQVIDPMQVIDTNEAPRSSIDLGKKSIGATPDGSRCQIPWNWKDSLELSQEVGIQLFIQFIE